MLQQDDSKNSKVEHTLICKTDKYFRQGYHYVRSEPGERGEKKRRRKKNPMHTIESDLQRVSLSVALLKDHEISHTGKVATGLTD